MNANLIQKNEIWNFTTGTPIFEYTVIFVKDNEEVKRLQSVLREDKIDLESLDLAEATVIPAEHLSPFPVEELKQFTGQPSNDVYVKGSGLGSYDMMRDIARTPAELILEEAKFLNSHLLEYHPNITRYLGYLLSDDGRIRGLCFERYERKLFSQVEVDKRKIDWAQCSRDIKAGIDYLHSKNVVHNDINDMNIMFKADGTAVIIDFDSARFNGERLGPKRGVDLYATEAEFNNDWRAFQSLCNKYGPQQNAQKPGYVQHIRDLLRTLFPWTCRSGDSS